MFSAARAYCSPIRLCLRRPPAWRATSAPALASRSAVAPTRAISAAASPMAGSLRFPRKLLSTPVRENEKLATLCSHTFFPFLYHPSPTRLRPWGPPDQRHRPCPPLGAPEEQRQLRGAPDRLLGRPARAQRHRPLPCRLRSILLPRPQRIGRERGLTDTLRHAYVRASSLRFQLSSPF